MKDWTALEKPSQDFSQDSIDCYVLDTLTLWHIANSSKPLEWLFGFPISKFFVGSCRSLIHFSSNGDSNRWLLDFSVLWTEPREKILPGSVTVSPKWYPTKQGCWRLLNKEGHWPAPDMKHIEDTDSPMTLHLFIFAIFFKLISDLCICFLTWLCSYPSAHDNMDAGLCKLSPVRFKATV